jgi:redox-sensitive bicupin YhaK (pirin superfamily)
MALIEEKTKVFDKTNGKKKQQYDLTLFHSISHLLSFNRAHLVSDVNNSGVSTPIKINQDANVHVAEVSSGHSVDFPLSSGRQGYLLCIEGTATVTGDHGEETLEQHDAAEVYGENTFKVTPKSGSTDKVHVLFIEMAFTGDGRTDLE